MALPLRNLLAGAVLGTFAALSLVPQPASALESGDRAEIETIVREYLLANPDLLVEMSNALQAKRDAEQRVQQQDAISSARPAIFDNPADPVLGNPDGDVTVVEFFDYNCGYCKRALSDMTSMLESDDQLKFVLKEFPVLGPESEEAHKVALAFLRLMPQKYPEFHLQLLGFQGRANEDSAMKIATSLGADEDALRVEMADPSLGKPVRDAYDLADALGINGTPAYVIGDEVVSGALGEDVLMEKVENVRQCGSTQC